MRILSSNRFVIRLARAFSFLTNAILIGLLASFTQPGTHRVLSPGSFGLTEIAPRIWTDAPGRAGDLTGLVETSQNRVAAFFGDAPPNPTLILCSTRVCARDFGIGGNGLSVADAAVMVSPGGLTIGTLTHEMTHSRLHRRMGVSNIWRQPYPTWFDEGLATHVADHPRWRGNITPAHRAEVRKARRFWQWDDAFDALGVGRAYRSAAAEVAAIERVAGRAGLLELIARAEAGEDFDTVLAENLRR
ncbi:MAG: hypothetical protein HKN27_04105 [Silicimonas sp.]|nr:hypothetical protein [Silicimonas sp.]